jgi:ABC-type branched-subunit amino acid transport system substrate-binding protein
MRHPIMVGAAALLFGAVALQPALAQKHYDAGVTDTEIKIGQTAPLSGPFSVSGNVAKAQITFFKMINHRGGVNGRKIDFIVYDDGYNPARTVEQTRKLVEEDHVFLDFGSTGTPTNLAVRKYLNANNIPQLFLISGAPQFNDPKNFPWSIPGAGNYVTEGRIDAQYILKNKPDAKIAVLYQNGDLGGSFLKGLRQQLGDQADKMIVSAISFEPTDPTVDSQIISLAQTHATVFADYALPKIVAQALRKSLDLGWHPLHIIPAIAAIPEAAFKPVGYENAVGTISLTALKDPTDKAQWGNSPDFKAFGEWMAKYNTSSPDPNSVLNSVAYGSASLLIDVLTKCGDDLTRANVIKVAGSLDVPIPMFLPGIRFHITPDNYDAFRQAQIARFNGTKMVPIGQLISVQ